MSKCAYCGVEDDSVRTHSGVQECWPCWDYRKMDRPAALHWARVGAEFLSNVDLWDLGDYLPKACGLGKEEMYTMLRAARKVEITSRYLKENGPRHNWTPEVEGHWEYEMRDRRLL